MSRVLVYCEVEEGAIRKGSRQALGAAKKIAGGAVAALLIGKGAEQAAAGLAAFGVAKATVVPYDGAYSTAVFAGAAAEAIAAGPCIFLASHTAISKDFAPRVGARSRTRLRRQR